ncbi:MAG TPA: hypothetical protein PLR25_27030 [Planctomycetaceae bacterium]|nr:hypothetical protein [Planctomycetaceae bacterium]
MNTFQNANLVDELFHGISRFAINIGNVKESSHSKAVEREQAWAKRSFLFAESDASGRVQIRNLPGGMRESFRVTADGFVLPRSSLYFDVPHDRREAYVELVAGETIESTIYLDREQSVEEREVLVIDDEGNPLENVAITLTEMRVGPKDWQLWSVQRFGAVQSAKSNEDGRVVLSVPSPVGETPVERLRLAINYDGSPGKSSGRGRDLRYWLNGGLVNVPLKPDGGLVAVIQDPDPGRQGKAVYGKLEDLLPKRDAAELLNAMIENPGLAILRQLLEGSKSTQPEPIELLDESRNGGDHKGVRVEILPGGESSVAVVLAKVRPADGSRREENDFQSLPECAFVFDLNGKLIATLGGRIGTTGAGSAENVDIVCLGPAEDWFVRVTRFQDNGPFKYQSEYYRMANPVVPSLRYFHYANSNGWSNGPETVPRYGRLHFGFPDDRGPSQINRIGTTPDGRTFNDTIFWDGDKNQFVGAEELTAEKRPLFRVDKEWSKDFSPLTTTSSQITLLGGEREYDHWYAWETCVPVGFEAIVRVSIPQKEGAPRVLEQKYAAGRRSIQFHAKPSDDGPTVALQLGYGKDETIQTAELPHAIGDPPKSIPAIVNTLNAGESVQLLNQSLKTSSESLVLSVQLQAVP